MSRVCKLLVIACVVAFAAQYIAAHVVIALHAVGSQLNNSVGGL